MNIYVPWALIALFIAFYIFRENNRRIRLRREERREHLQCRTEELLNYLGKSKNLLADGQKEQREDSDIDRSLGSPGK